MNDIELFRQLVTTQDNKVTTTSRKVAESFGKRHDNVLAAIERLECSKEFAELNFKVCFENSELQNGKPLKYYIMTKDGMAFLCMGFTGKKAAEFKEAYINAFNWMHETIKVRDELNRQIGDYSKREAVSVSDGSFHGRGLAKRRIEKHQLADELKELSSRLQIAFELIEQK
ncbi:MAG: Rha family transcriptional regulator [Aeromonadaceae bacterium]